MDKIKKNETKKIKILVTGGSGFIGRSLLENLNNHRDKYDVLVLSRKPIEKANFFIGNLMSHEEIKNAFRGVDVVIHLAHSKNYPENILMLNNLIRACKENKIKKIIFSSSMSARRQNPDEYGKMKMRMERILRKSGMNYTILRPSIVYGKGSTSFNFLIEKIKKIPLFTPIIGNGKYFLMPVHIDDVVFAIEKSIDNENTDKKAYDIVGKDKIYFIELVEKLKKDMGIRKKNLKVPIFVAKGVSIILPKVIGRENVKNLTEDSLADITAANLDFGYNPRGFPKGERDGIL